MLDWDKFGAHSFVMEILEELERMKEQTPKEFREDLNTLKDIWLEKYDPDNLY